MTSPMVSPSLGTGAQVSGSATISLPAARVGDALARLQPGLLVLGQAFHSGFQAQTTAGP